MRPYCAYCNTHHRHDANHRNRSYGAELLGWFALLVVTFVTCAYFAGRTVGVL